MTDHMVPFSQCPHCGDLADAAQELTNQGAPDEGDCSICLECGGLSTFQADGGRRRPTTTEYDAFLADPTIAAAIGAWAIANARRQP